MKRILIGLCALSLFTGLALAPKAAAQSITITVGPATDDSFWVWSDEYQCWVWNGPEFQGDYQGHPYSYWHGRHEGGGDRNHRPGKGERSEGERPVNKGDVEQPKAEVERPNAEQRKAEVEKPKEQQRKTEVEKPKAEEKAKTEKPKAEEKAKTEKPKAEKKKDDSKSKGE
jgi:hypothetical protein